MRCPVLNTTVNGLNGRTAVVVHEVQTDGALTRRWAEIARDAAPAPVAPQVGAPAVTPARGFSAVNGHMPRSCTSARPPSTYRLNLQGFGAAAGAGALAT